MAVAGAGDDDDAPDTIPGGVRGPECEEAADRAAHQHRPVQLQMVDERQEVLCVLVDSVSPRRPVAASATTPVICHDLVVC